MQGAGLSDHRDPERLRNEMARSLVDPAILRDLQEQRERIRLQREERRATAPGPVAPVRRAPRRGAPGMETFGSASDDLDVEPTTPVIIEVNPDYPQGADAARAEIVARLERLEMGDRLDPGRGGRRYVFADLTESEIREFYQEPVAGVVSPVLRMWRDQPLTPFLDRSVRTVKADACMSLFGADGAGIVVAVADSGIERTHPHFAASRNLEDLPAGVEHRDFTRNGSGALTDGYGHGTHVAGIVAGRTGPDVPKIRVGEVKDGTGSVTTIVSDMPMESDLRGVAPKAKIVSLKVLDDAGKGYSSALIEALEYVYDLNEAGRTLRIHCVNLSLGYPFEAEWSAAGHSPLCEVVNRLSRSGVVVVAAAGNDGSVLMQTEGRTNRQRVGMDQSINDPGNADEAITVGATHAESPHTYGISYFSSRGPTADGRVKPDLVAPGERILSCAALLSAKFNKALAEAGAEVRPGFAYFREESGTSMAAPHVAGAVAALLSVRREFIGRPAAVKEVLMSSCTDLRRKADFQGAGLLDILRAIQSI